MSGGWDNDDDEEMVEIAGTIIHETARAWLVSDGAQQFWLPKSRVEYDGSTFSVPEWLAEEKGLL